MRLGHRGKREQCESYAELTLSAATASQPVHRLRQGERDREEGRRLGPVTAGSRAEEGVSDDVLDEALDYRKMANPHG